MTGVDELLSSILIKLFIQLLVFGLPVNGNNIEFFLYIEKKNQIESEPLISVPDHVHVAKPKEYVGSSCITDSR